MGTKSYISALEYNTIQEKLKNSLNLADNYLQEISAVLMLKALGNVVGKNRPFQKNIEDLKDILPIVLRSKYFNNWRYKYKAICNGENCNIILRPNSQNNYEYVQLTFDGAAQELKTNLVENDKVIIIKRKDSEIYEIYKIPVSDSTFTENDDFLAINPINTEDKTSFDSPIIEIKKSEKKYPLNQILYGPPGTGKTHNAINHALAIANELDLQELIEAEKANPANRKKAKEDFDDLVKQGRIQFVTFHQSYSYEEFVEGIKPTINLEGEVEYNINDGVFKKLCLEASKSESYDFEEIYDDFVSEVNAAKTLPLKTSVRKKDFVLKVDDKGNVFAKTANSGTEIKKEALRNYMDKGTIPAWWGSYIRSVGEYLKEKYKSKIVRVDNSKMNYVLIIDEINRGNISKIFGELITLIEDSKRIGASESLKIKLTYSGTDENESFGVPNNLYIIGTMNSADRSIALIDTALRRRFTFFEYTADHLLLSEDIEGINLRALVLIINKRIEILLNKDHLIGHAYFINVKSKNDLCEVFRNKVIPLLEEYFYGDYEKIQLVLGDNIEFGKTKENKVIIERKVFKQDAIFGKDLDGFEDKNLFDINEDIVHGNFNKISKEFFTSIYLKL